MKRGIAEVLIFTLAIAAGGGALVYKYAVKSDIEYGRANKLIEEEKYTEAADVLAELGEFRDVPMRLRRFNYVVTSIETGDGFRVDCDYTFNRYGYETKRSMTSSSGGEGSIEKSYDTHNRLTRLENDNIYEEGRHDKTKYQYDSIGRIEKTTYESTNGSTSVIIRTEYEYNSDNQLKHAGSTTRKNGEYTGAEEIFCYYDDKKCISKVSYKIDPDGKKTESRNIVYQYDDYGRLVEKAVTDDKDGAKNREKAVYLYGRGGMLRSVETETYSGSDGTRTVSKFLYEYKLDKLMTIRADTGDETDFYEFTYDKYGNMATYTYTSSDGSGESQSFEYAIAGYDMPVPLPEDPVPEPDAMLGAQIPSL